MNQQVEMFLNGEWVVVELAPDDCRDRLPSPKMKPVYRTFSIRTNCRDPEVSARVLDWLARE